MSGEGFLSRWSRRKRAAEAGRPVGEAPAAAPAEAPLPQPAAPAPLPVPAEPEPEFDIASLPPIESLTLESDIAAFLRKEVPEALKRAALRKAWTLDPAIRDFVGPADYAWDFNAPDGVPGFSLDLGGDAQALLAQAMGFDDREPAADSRPPAQDAGPEPPAAPAGDAPAAEPPVLLAGVPQTEAPPAEADAVQESARTARRHGSAVPN